MRIARAPASPCRVLLSVLLLVVVLLPTTQGFFVPRPRAPPRCRQQQQQHPRPLVSMAAASESSGSGYSGYRGQARNDEEIVDLSGDGGVTKRVLRPGFGYKQETPPKHAYCKVAFVMKTGTGQVIADRMNKPMEFMLVRFFPGLVFGF